MTHFVEVIVRAGKDGEAATHEVSRVVRKLTSQQAHDLKAFTVKTLTEAHTSYTAANLPPND